MYTIKEIYVLNGSKFPFRFHAPGNVNIIEITCTNTNGTTNGTTPNMGWVEGNNIDVWFDNQGKVYTLPTSKANIAILPQPLTMKEQREKYGRDKWLVIQSTLSSDQYGIIYPKDGGYIGTSSLGYGPTAYVAGSENTVNTASSKWLIVDYQDAGEVISTRQKCSCDFVSVILVTGCHCGGT